MSFGPTTSIAAERSAEAVDAAESIVAPVVEVSTPARAPGARLLSIDAYRGFVMLLMASNGLAIAGVVQRNHLTSPVWKLLAFHTTHVAWRGCGLWDLIQPSFTFIVGVALPFSLAKRQTLGQSRTTMVLHAVYRSLLLIALGVFLRSIGQKLTYFTFEDTLSQIGLGYTFVFLLAWTRPRTQAIAALLILFAFWAAYALYPLPGPGFDYSSVGVNDEFRAHHFLSGFAAHWNKNTNLGARVDQWFLNLFPREHHFVFNEGGYLTLSFISTLATMILGLLVGGLLRTPWTPARKMGVLLLAGIAGIGLGLLLDRLGICPNVKRIWTPTWTIFSAGWTCVLLTFFYTIMDWIGWRRWAFPLLVVGMNSIAMYCLSDGGFARWVLENLRTHLGPWHVFPAIAGIYAPIVESSVVLLVLWSICWWMYRRKLFLRI